MKSADNVELTGQTVDRYSIVALIGAGGQGRVYRGRDERLQRDVAIKVVSAERSSDAASRQKLMTEARVLSRLNDPHVAAIYDFVTHRGRDFIVMEFVAGATLRDMIAGGPLPAGEVLRLGSHIARGLASAHAANIVHRDIKPANLKVTSFGELKILDFGVARLLPAGTLLDNGPYTVTESVVAGTVPYMAPEQLNGEDADERSDIFSAGVVLYEMATGIPAFPVRNLPALVEAVLHEEPAAPSVVNPHLPLALERVIVKAMQKNPDARHESAAELTFELERLMPVGWSSLPAMPVTARPQAWAAAAMAEDQRSAPDSDDVGVEPLWVTGGDLSGGARRGRVPGRLFASV
jgi:eukaryotic-like serine/threonine-protein kinase